jgi:ribosomal protein L21E
MGEDVEFTPPEGEPTPPEEQEDDTYDDLEIEDPPDLAVLGLKEGDRVAFYQRGKLKTGYTIAPDQEDNVQPGMVKLIRDTDGGEIYVFPDWLEPEGKSSEAEAEKEKAAEDLGDTATPEVVEPPDIEKELSRMDLKPGDKVVIDRNSESLPSLYPTDGWQVHTEESPEPESILLVFGNSAPFIFPLKDVRKAPENKEQEHTEAKEGTEGRETPKSDEPQAPESLDEELVKNVAFELIARLQAFRKSNAKKHETWPQSHWKVFEDSEQQMILEEIIKRDAAHLSEELQQRLRTEVVKIYEQDAAVKAANETKAPKPEVFRPGDRVKYEYKGVVTDNWIVGERLDKHGEPGLWIYHEGDEANQHWVSENTLIKEQKKDLTPTSNPDDSSDKEKWKDPEVHFSYGQNVDVAIGDISNPKLEKWEIYDFYKDQFGKVYLKYINHSQGGNTDKVGQPELERLISKKEDYDKQNVSQSNPDNDSDDNADYDAPDNDPNKEKFPFAPGDRVEVLTKKGRGDKQEDYSVEEWQIASIGRNEHGIVEIKYINLSQGSTQPEKVPINLQALETRIAARKGLDGTHGNQANTDLDGIDDNEKDFNKGELVQIAKPDGTLDSGWEIQGFQRADGLAGYPDGKGILVTITKEGEAPQQIPQNRLLEMSHHFKSGDQVNIVVNGVVEGGWKVEGVEMHKTHQHYGSGKKLFVKMSKDGVTREIPQSLVEYWQSAYSVGDKVQWRAPDEPRISANTTPDVVPLTPKDKRLSRKETGDKILSPWWHEKVKKWEKSSLLLVRIPTIPVGIIAAGTVLNPAAIPVTIPVYLAWRRHKINQLQKQAKNPGALDERGVFRRSREFVGDKWNRADLLYRSGTIVRAGGVALSNTVTGAAEVTMYAGNKIRRAAEKSIDQSIKLAKVGGRLALIGGGYVDKGANFLAKKGMEYAQEKTDQFGRINPELTTELKETNKNFNEDMRKLVNYARKRLQKAQKEQDDDQNHS